MQEMKTITFRNKKITIKELTVKQVREGFMQIEKDDPLFIDDLMDQPIPALIISLSTGIPVEELEEHKPSDLAALSQEVSSVNPSVASLIKKRLAIFERMQALSSDQILTGRSAT